MPRELKKKVTKPLIGFIGQGFVGKSYADDFAFRGYPIVRYSAEKKHVGNREQIALCDMVFIAVPTPTTPAGFDVSIIRSVLALVGKGKIAVLKSTITPGMTKRLQVEFPDIFVFHSPEFLTEVTAAKDARSPDRNIVGIPKNTAANKTRAKRVLSVLPKAPYSLVCDSTEAELIKYGGNCWFYFKVVFINMLYDLSRTHGGKWDIIQKALTADPRIGPTHLNPVHKKGRGAGGHCFIKDMPAFHDSYLSAFPDDTFGAALLAAVEKKNIDLLVSTGKDLELLAGVYGNETITAHSKSR